jgi:sugar phosphate isomerase/epimerase
LERAYQGGCRDQLCSRWYSLALIAAGQNEDATRVIEEWVQLTPNNNEARLFLQAIAQPEHFSEILASLGLNYYAVSNSRNKVDGESIERVEAGHAVHEMIAASGNDSQPLNISETVTSNDTQNNEPTLDFHENLQPANG